MAGLTGRGWLDMTHRRVQLDVGAARTPVEIVGTDDAHLGLDDYARVSAPADPRAALTIGITHAPYLRVLDAMAADGARLLIAGHTHGGQLRVPGHGALVTNCDLDTSRAKGLSRWWPGAARARPRAMPPEGAAYLHVSAGLGAAPTSPFRPACRPEACLRTPREARR